MANLDRCWLALSRRRSLALACGGTLDALLTTAAASCDGLSAANFDALSLTLFSGAGRLNFAGVGGALRLADRLRTDGSGRRFGWAIVASGLCGGLVRRFIGSSFFSRGFSRLFSSSFRSRSFLSSRLFGRTFLSRRLFGSRRLLDRSVGDDLLGRSLFFWSFGLCRLVSHL